MSRCIAAIAIALSFVGCSADATPSSDANGMGGDFGGACSMDNVPQPTCETPSGLLGWCVESTCHRKCDHLTDVATCADGSIPVTRDPSDPADCYCAGAPQ